MAWVRFEKRERGKGRPAQVAIYPTGMLVFNSAAAKLMDEAMDYAEFHWDARDRRIAIKPVTKAVPSVTYKLSRYRDKALRKVFASVFLSSVGIHVGKTVQIPVEWDARRAWFVADVGKLLEVRSGGEADQST